MSAATDFDDFVRRAGIQYEVGSLLQWEIGKEGSGLWLSIPRGFHFDSSIPIWLRWLISPHRREWLLAACVHDFLLINGFDKAFAAGEWYRASLAKDAGNPLLRPALLVIILWTVK